MSSAGELLGAIDDFVFGHALRAGEARSQKSAQPYVASASMRFAQRQLETGHYPHTAALFGGMDARTASERLAVWNIDEARLLRRATGRTAHQWIIACRMAEARRRLLHSDELVDVIAERVGYRDPTQFIRMFRRHHGATPAAWRQQRVASAVR